MGKYLVSLPKHVGIQWESHANITPAFRSFRAELALLKSSKPGDIEDLASVKLSEAGLDHTELVKLAVNAGVPKAANTLRKTVRQAKRAFKLFATTHKGGLTPRDAIPLPLIQELCCLLDISDVYRTPLNDARRQPAKPCPFAAQELYDRLLLARRRAWWVPALPTRTLLGGGGGGGRRGKDRGNPQRRPWYITDSELARLLEPVVGEMRACLEYVESFCRFLRTTAGERRRGIGAWGDLSELRTCVFKLMGFWPHDVEEDYPGYAFDLPSELCMLLYPQVCLDLDEMVNNLEEIVLGPGWDSLRRLEAIACGSWAAVGERCVTTG